MSDQISQDYKCGCPKKKKGIKGDGGDYHDDSSLIPLLGDAKEKTNL